MKKVMAIAIALLLIPCAGHGMQLMSEKEMSRITGQSGIVLSGMQKLEEPVLEEITAMGELESRQLREADQGLHNRFSRVEIYEERGVSQQGGPETSVPSGVAITIDNVVLHESGSEIWYQNNIGGSSSAIGMVEN